MTEYKPEDLAKASFKFFFTRILGNKWAPHFDEWQWLIEHNLRFLLECARGHGKTVFFTGYVLWLVYKDLPVEVLFMAHSEEQVKLNIMNKIEAMIMQNDYLNHLRPSSTQLWGAQLKTFRSGASIRGESFGSSIRGAHPDYIFEDDPLKDKGGMTPEEQYNYHMTAVSGMAKKNTVIGVVGTPLDNGDLLEQLENNKAYCFKAYPALNEKGEALFPQLFDADRLKAIEDEVGSFAFSREFLLKRIDAKTQVFKDQFKTINLKMDYPQLALVRIIIDPAISEKESACDSAITTVGVDYKNEKWELDTRLVHSDDPHLILDEIIKVVYKYIDKFYDLAICIESEIFQKVLAFDLRKLLLQKNLNIRVIEMVHHGIQGKHQRIIGLQPDWEARAIHLLPESPLIPQFRYYRPNIRGFKLDGLDAFSWIRSEDVSVPVIDVKVIEGDATQAWDI